MAEIVNVGQKTARNSVWIFGRKIVTNFLRLITVGILARHLSPDDFGIVALAQVLLQFILVSQNFNGPAIHVIYDRAEGWENRVHSAFWFNVFAISIQVLLYVPALPIVTHFYHQPELPALLNLFVSVVIARQLGAIPDAVLKRSLIYRPLVVRDTILDFISAISSVVMALYGLGIWSLVLPQLAAEWIRLIFAFILARWSPQFYFGFRDWRRIWQYSFPMLGTELLLFVIRDGDTVIISKILGSTALGFYNLAWQLSNLVGRNITAVISDVSISTLSSISNDQKRLQNNYLRMLRLLGALVIPISGGMFIMAEELIMILYGPNWEPAIGLLRILIMFTVIRAVSSPTGLIYSVVGRNDIGFKYNLAFLPFYLLAIVIGVNYGLYGVAVAVTGVRIFGAIGTLILTNQLLGLSMRQIIQCFKRPFQLTIVIMIIVAFLRSFLLTEDAHLLLTAITCFSLGSLLYSTGLLWTDRQTYNELNRFISSFLPSIGRKMTHFTLWVDSFRLTRNRQI